MHRPGTVSPVLDISVDPMDSEATMCLAKLYNGDPLTSNVIKVGDFSQFNGTFFPGSMWCYFSSENQKETRWGYWEPIGNVQRIVIHPIASRKMTLRFHLGQPPGGERTSCVMHKYKMDRIDTREINNLQNSSLCRIFWETSGPQLVDQSDLDEDHGRYVHDQLPRMLENEGNPHSGQDISSSHRELCDAIREGDFLEWNDLCGPETSSRSLENSTNVLPMVDEHNLQAVLEQMVEADNIHQNLQAVLEQMVEAEDNSESSMKQSIDFKFSIVAASNSETVVMKAPVSAPGIPVGDRCGLDGEHRDYLDDQLSRMLQNEGNPHRDQDLSNGHRVINGDESLPGRGLFDFFFKPPDHMLNPQELCDAAGEQLPDYTFTRQEVNEENPVDEVIRIIDRAGSGQAEALGEDPK